MSRRAVVLAGGRGTRLHPYTLVLPKPLMPIGEYPILEIIVRQLVKARFSHVTIAVNYQADAIKEYFQNGEKWGLKIDYTFEHTPLGTMGPLRLINDLPDNFLVMNGDILTDLDYATFYDAHCKEKSVFTISSKKREHRVDYGVLDVNSNNYLVGFREKPVETFYVSMGIYMVSHRIVDVIPSNLTYGFDALMLDLLAAGMPAKVSPFSGYWLDIGRPDDYNSAIELFERVGSKFFIDDVSVGSVL